VGILHSPQERRVAAGGRHPPAFPLYRLVNSPVLLSRRLLLMRATFYKHSGQLPDRLPTGRKAQNGAAEFRAGADRGVTDFPASREGGRGVTNFPASRRGGSRTAPLARKAGVGCSVGVPPAVAWASCPRPRGSGTLLLRERRGTACRPLCGHQNKSRRKLRLTLRSPLAHFPLWIIMSTLRSRA
jgi:hypothetical protein